MSSRPEKKQSGVRNSTSKRKKRFRGTQKQDVAVKEREETPAVEVTLVGEDDVVKEKKFLSSAGSPSKRKIQPNDLKSPRMKYSKLFGAY